jgi:hypothetical protein
MRVIGTTLVVVMCIAFSGAGVAQPAHPMRPLAGYKCMMLNLTEQQYLDPTVRVWVRAQPSPDAPKVGWAATNVAVRDPLHMVDGFTEALFPDGRTVWIESRMLRPYHSLGDPTAQCVPYLMSNGRLGFTRPH